MAIEDDLRFASHHDMMRVMERAAVRGQLPLRYSQGFNPRPLMSLPCPRNVGLASDDDLLVLTLDEPIDSDELRRRLGDQLPTGAGIRRVAPLETTQNPQVRGMCLKLQLTQDQLPLVRQRLDQLEAQKSWPVQREKPSRRGRAVTRREIDLRPLLSYELSGETLSIELRVVDAQQPRPAEALTLLGLDERLDLARAVRTRVDYGIQE
jgi:radical SAM-linked protein